MLRNNAFFVYLLCNENLMQYVEMMLMGDRALTSGVLINRLEVRNVVVLYIVGGQIRLIKEIMVLYEITRPI